MTDPWRAKKVGFVFTGGRKARQAGIQEFPDDFFYGYTRYAGAKKLIEINEFKPWQGGLAALALEKLFLRVPWRCGRNLLWLTNLFQPWTSPSNRRC